MRCLLPWGSVFVVRLSSGGIGDLGRAVEVTEAGPFPLPRVVRCYSDRHPVAPRRVVLLVVVLVLEFIVTLAGRGWFPTSPPVRQSRVPLVLQTRPTQRPFCRCEYESCCGVRSSRCFSRSHGAPEPQSPRAPEPQSHGATEPRSHGATELRSHGAPEPRSPRATEPRSYGEGLITRRGRCAGCLPSSGFRRS
jgi:hypothetical protein